MASYSDSQPQLPVVENIHGEVSGNDAWQNQRASALQVMIACQIYRSEYGQFPNPLSEALKIMDHNLREQRKLKKIFEFRDPASGNSHEWIYDSKAAPESSDIIIESPKSADGLRVVCRANGQGAIVDEKSYSQMKSPEY